VTITAHLLTTKLHIPPPRSNVVPRPRLIERLDEGLRWCHRLTLVSAPAGFGKTTLVTEWICGSAREVAWVSLDEGDNDPVQFLNYLVAALQQVDGGIGRPVQQILQSPQLPPTQGLITPLINDVTAVGTALTLVLDDYQLISAAAVHQMVQFLVEHQPPKMHVIISTREDPPLPLAQLHARGQVTEIRERDLRFTAEEATAFLNQAMGLSLSVEAVTALEAHTEGWIAGLQLAAVALQRSQEDVNTFIAAGCLSSAFTGDDRYEDERIIPLLADVRDVAPSFVDQLLDGAAIATPQQEIAARPLIEPLSERELEVLGLIAAGLSNREIAQELVIALGTVKRHINNIYGKLSVHRRTEAVAVSRDLGLI